MRTPPDSQPPRLEPGAGTSGFGVGGPVAGAGAGHSSDAASEARLRELASVVACIALVALSAFALGLAGLAAFGVVRIPAGLTGISIGSLAVPIVILTALTEAVPEDSSDEHGS